MGVTLTPNLGSFLLLKNSSFYSQSGHKITPKVWLFLLLTWVVFIFGSCFNSENGVKILVQDNSFLGVIFTPYLGCLYSFWSYSNSENGVEILGTG